MTWNLERSSTPVARKPHRCNGCGRTIDAGEQYSRTDGIWDGDWSRYLMCAHCEAAATWAVEYDLVDEGIDQDSLYAIADYADNPTALRVGVTYRIRWRKPDGTLRELPPTYRDYVTVYPRSAS